MRSGMANQIQPVSIFVGNNRQFCIDRHQVRGVYQHAVHLTRQRGARQAGTDTLRNFRDSNRVGKTAL